MSISKEFQPDIAGSLLSLIIPGVAQVKQRRYLIGIFQFTLAVILWYYWMGWVIHILSAYDAKRLWVHFND